MYFSKDCEQCLGKCKVVVKEYKTFSYTIQYLIWIEVQHLRHFIMTNSKLHENIYSFNNSLNRIKSIRYPFLTSN